MQQIKSEMKFKGRDWIPPFWKGVWQLTLLICLMNDYVQGKRNILTIWGTFPPHFCYGAEQWFLNILSKHPIDK